MQVIGTDTDAIGDFVVVDDGTPTGGPAHEAVAPAMDGLHVHPVVEPLEVAQRDPGRPPAVDTQGGRRQPRGDLLQYGLIHGHVLRRGEMVAPDQTPGRGHRG